MAPAPVAGVVEVASQPACRALAAPRQQLASSSGRQGGTAEQAAVPAPQLAALLWRHAALVALSAPAYLSLHVPAAAAAQPQLGWAGGSGWPPGGVGGSGGGGGGGDAALQRRPHEVLQLAAARPVQLTLVSFAVTRKAYGRITKAFVREYEERTGQAVRFRLAFGGSGSQARAVMDGLPADLVALALPLDVMKIQEAGLIRPDWAAQFPNSSVVVESVVSIVVRKGNPKGVRGWEDLARPDVSVVTANPKTAGVARWIFLALWGHRLLRGEAAAMKYVTQVFDRVVVQPRDAREASDVFYRQGTGDVLLTYENEAYFTNLMVPEASRLPYIVPDNNIRIQCPVTLVDANLAGQGPEVREAATAFVSYLYTPPAQREFTACGFRSPVAEMAKESIMPSVKGLWAVDKRLGGWNAVQKKFFDDGGVLSEVTADVSARQQLARAAARR